MTFNPIARLRAVVFGVADRITRYKPCPSRSEYLRDTRRS